MRAYPEDITDDFHRLHPHQLPPYQPRTRTHATHANEQLESSHPLSPNRVPEVDSKRQRERRCTDRTEDEGRDVAVDDNSCFAVAGVLEDRSRIPAHAACARRRRKRSSRACGREEGGGARRELLAAVWEKEEKVSVSEGGEETTTRWLGKAGLRSRSSSPLFLVDSFTAPVASALL